MTLFFFPFLHVLLRSGVGVYITIAVDRRCQRRAGRIHVHVFTAAVVIAYS